MNRIKEAGFTLMELLHALFILIVGIGGTALVIWVIVHFLKKVW